MYTLDTNAIIYFLKGNAELRRTFMSTMLSTPIFVSAVTEIELFSYPHLDLEEERTIEMFISQCLVIPIDSRLARIAASVKRTYSMSLPDSVIAATALSTQSVLFTRNVSDFKKVSDLRWERV